jgi:hypothetical protein
MKRGRTEPPYKTNTYFKLLEAMPMPGCAVCRLANVALHQYVDDLFSEHLWVMERRAEMRLGRGVCPAHAPLMDEFGRVLGLAVLHHDILGHALDDVDSAMRTPLGKRALIRSVANAVKPQQECLFCRYADEQAEFAVRTLIAEWHDQRLHAAFSQSSGLCLPHFEMALRMRDASEDNLADLIEVERAILGRLEDDLAEFIRKSNLAYAHEAKGREADAPRQALAVVSGKTTDGDSRFVRAG